MKRLLFLVTAMAFLASGSIAVARRDANRDALQQQWKQQQQEQKKIDAQFKAIEADAKAAIAEPKMKSADKPTK
jgi:outer membrane biogenesis lipoprotein LolB